MKRYIVVFLLIYITGYAESLEDYRLQFKNIKNGVEYLSKDYLDDTSLKTDYKLSKRFNDGYVTYLLQDYAISTMIFYDIVSRKQFKNEPVYLESLFYLAESFRRLKNYLGAREYYQQVLEYNNSKFHQKALRYFLELSRLVGDFRGTDKYMNDLESSTKLIDSSVYYEKGKALFNQRRYEEAIDNFLKIKSKDPLKIKALYYIAVSYTAMAKSVEYQFANARNSYLRKERGVLGLKNNLIDKETAFTRAETDWSKKRDAYKEYRKKHIIFNKWFYTLKRVNKKLRAQKEERNQKYKELKQAFEDAEALYKTATEELAEAKSAIETLNRDLDHLKSQRETLKAPYKKRLEDYKKAIAFFEKVKKQEVMEETDHLIIDQATLSVARIYYTIGNLPEAIDAYQDIERNSKFYDISLYESAWTYVRAKEPKKALYAVDLLVDVLPDSPIVPDALLLRANLYNEMGEFEKATEAYSYIEERYSSISKELQKIIDDNDDLEAYFSNIISSNLNSFSASKFLPKEALKYVRSEKLVKKAQTIVKDIQTTRSNLKESMDILNKLLKILSDKQSVSALFPKTDDVRGEFLKYTNLLLGLDYNLNNFYYKNYLNKNNKELKLLKLKTLKLWDLIKRTPKSKSQYQKRKDNLNNQYIRLTKKAYNAKMYIANLEKQIKAMEVLFSDNIKKYSYSKEKQDLFYKNISLKKKKLALIKERLAKVTKKVDGWKASINNVDKAHVADKKIRKKLLKLLLEERAYYTSLPLYQNSKTLLTDIDVYRNKVNELSNSLDQIIIKKAILIKNDIMKEKESLDGYKLEIDDKVKISNKLSTIIALTSFKAVNNKFYELILNADLGELEVIWKGKDKLSKKIQFYYSQERDRLKILDSEFKEILGENQ